MIVDKIVTLFAEYAPIYGYQIVFLASLLENSIFLGAIIPGEVTLILAGFYAGQGLLTWSGIVVLSLLGSTIGDNIGFYIGKRKGRKWLEGIGKYFGYREEKIDRAEDFWKDYGGKAIFLGRFIAVARTFVPFLAGASKVNHKTFFLYDIAGAALHSVLMVTLGYFFGEYWESLVHTFGIIGVVLLVIFVIFVYRYLVRKGIKRVEE